MGWTYGKMHYNYKIKINFEKLMESIADKFDGAEDWYFDGDELIITGGSVNKAKSYYAPATRWEPAEYEEEFTEDTLEDANIDQLVIDALNETKEQLMSSDKSIGEFEFDEDSFEFEADEYEPDPDAKYEAWRDGC